MMRTVALALVALVLACSSPSDPGGQAPKVATNVDDWRDEVLYQLLTDRFENGDRSNDTRVSADPARYHGGDWRGVIDRLDYLKSLGISAIWISPVVRNVDKDTGDDGYHGYWALDFTRPNPHFGDAAVLRALVDEAHAKGIKVIVDIVTNHAGQVFAYDLDRDGQVDPGELDVPYERLGVGAPLLFPQADAIFPELFRYPESYHRRGSVSNWNDREQLLWADFPGGLKDLATERSDVRDALIDVYAKWALDFDFDGYRIDTLKHVDEAFWDAFPAALRTRLAAAGKRKFFLFGEAFDGNDGILGSYTRPGRLDSVLHFSQKFRVFDEVFGGTAPAARIAEVHEARARSYGSAAHEGGIGLAPRDALVGFIDNHDLPRFLSSRDTAEGRRRLRAALSYLLTAPGVPCLYYGTEQEFAGGADPANREDLWASGWRTDGETFRRIAKLTEVRRAHPALRRGSFDIRWASAHTGTEQDSGVIAFERRHEEDAVIVAVNTGPHESLTSLEATGGPRMSVSLAPGTKLIDVLGNARHTVGPDGSLVVGLGPFQAAVLVRDSEP